MNNKLVKLWQDAHLRAKSGEAEMFVPNSDVPIDPLSAIIVMRFICRTLGVNEPPTECDHEYEPIR